MQIDRSGIESIDGEFRLRAVEEVSAASDANVVSEPLDGRNSKQDVDATPFLIAKGLCREFDLSDPLLVRLLSFRRKRILHAVSDVSFEIERGTTYALVGESGSGKSTIARMAVGLLAPTHGGVTIDGTDLNDPDLDQGERQALRRRIQMVFQSPFASLNPRWRISAILAEPLRAFNLAPVSYTHLTLPTICSV